MIQVFNNMLKTNLQYPQDVYTYWGYPNADMRSFKHKITGNSFTPNASTDPFLQKYDQIQTLKTYVEFIPTM